MFLRGAINVEVDDLSINSNWVNALRISATGDV